MNSISDAFLLTKGSDFSIEMILNLNRERGAIRERALETLPFLLLTKGAILYKQEFTMKIYQKMLNVLN